MIYFFNTLKTGILKQYCLHLNKTQSRPPPEGAKDWKINKIFTLQEVVNATSMQDYYPHFFHFSWLRCKKNNWKSWKRLWEFSKYRLRVFPSFPDFLTFPTRAQIFKQRVFVSLTFPIGLIKLIIADSCIFCSKWSG